jgi:beta-galactosidase
MPRLLRVTSLVPSLHGLAFGADYNPEQWPRHVWAEDVARMRDAGVTMMTVGVFSWALLEPEEGRYTLDWLADVVNLLAAAGIAVDLATATASPPPWLSRAHPEMLPVTAGGVVLSPGSRQAYCPSSPIFRERAAALTNELATTFGYHPAVVMWHVGNEYACHTTCCYCDVSADAFRSWLRERYPNVEALNDAWGTSFWSQHYGDFDEVLPPRAAPSFVNPGQQLDFRRFSSDEHLACFVAERDILHQLSPGVPVTTNFMVHRDVVDYWKWSREVDLVSNDHYLLADDPRSEIDLAFSADLTRGLAEGRPWLLMEHSTSAVNWQTRNVPKRPGQLVRNSMAHVARGSDGAMFFQWRASRAGAEKFHSAMVPHAGTDTRVWREVTRLGGLLDRCQEVADSEVRTDVALVFDWQSWWACDLDSHPSSDIRYADQARAWHRALWENHVTVDIVSADSDLSRYRLVIVPTLYAVGIEFPERLSRQVRAGGHAVITYFSGIVDGDDRVYLGGYPGAFRELIGARTEEFHPLLDGERVALDDGSVATTWTEDLRPEDAEVIASYQDGVLAGTPAVTRCTRGDGRAWYVATRLTQDSLSRLARRICDEAGVSLPDLPSGVELTRRVAGDRSWVFVINHSAEGVSLEVPGRSLETGLQSASTVHVAAGDVAVIAQD